MLQITMPQSLLFKRFIPVFFSVLTTLTCSAGDSDCEMIQYQVSCKVDKNKATYEYTYYYQINSREGDKHAKISVPYSKKNKVTIVEGWVEDANGTIVRRLKNSEITDLSAISDISFYQDEYIKKFELRNNTYPYRIHYKTRYVDNELMEIIDWYPVIDTEIATKCSELRVEVPKNYPIKIYEEQTHFVRTETQESIIYEWKHTDLKVLKSEILSPPHSDFLPRVIVLPENFNWFTKGCFSSWTSFGDWYSDITAGLDILPESEKIQTSQLLKGITDKREIVKRLYHYLQDHTRYINVSIKYGGLRPYPAEYVAQNKYGDCKALSNYLIALLKLYNIPAYYTVIYGDENPPKFLESFPSHQFNHIIVTVPLDKDTLFLETTSNIAPFGYLGEFTQNRKAFLIDKNNSRIIHTPALTVSEEAQHRKSVYNIDISGNCAAQLNLCFRGSSSEMYNSLGNMYTKDEQERILREHLLSFSAFEIENWELKKENRDSATVELYVKLKLTNFLQDYGNKKAFSLTAIYLPDLESPEKRTLPLRINTPYVLNDTLEYNFILSSECSGLPEDITIQSPYGSYSRTVKKKEKHIEIYRSIIINAGSYSLKEYPEFYSFIQNIKSNDRKKLLIPKN
jgi:hypothetical protein